METVSMTSMMTLPCQGHLDQNFHMCAYIKANHDGVLFFDPTVPLINKSIFICKDWSAAAHGECKEEIPPNMAES
eukprot:4040889-Ditylum_brightwellii.AAC.1